MGYEVLIASNIEELDTLNDNIDVCIRFDNGTEYNIVVITPENLSTLMKNSCKPYIMPDFRFLVVKEITLESIHQLVNVLIDDKQLLEYFGSDLS